MAARLWEFESPLRHHKKINGLAGKIRTADPFFISPKIILAPHWPHIVGFRFPFRTTSVCAAMIPYSQCEGLCTRSGLSPGLIAAATSCWLCQLTGCAFCRPPHPLFIKSSQNRPMAALRPVSGMIAAKNFTGPPWPPCPMRRLSTPKRVDFFWIKFVDIWINTVLGRRSDTAWC